MVPRLLKNLERLQPPSLKSLAEQLSSLTEGRLWLQVLIGMLLVVALAVGASVGSPATPGVGIVILATVLATVGIPPEGVALIIGVDRILDMSRTAINVAGDLTTCQIMDRWLGTSEPENSTDALQESV